MAQTYQSLLIMKIISKLQNAQRSDIKEEIVLMFNAYERGNIKEEPDIDVNNGTLFGKQGGKIAALFKQHLTNIE